MTNQEEGKIIPGILVKIIYLSFFPHIFLLLFKYGYFYYPPTAPHLSHPDLPPLILPPFGFVHVSFQQCYLQVTKNFINFRSKKISHVAFVISPQLPLHRIIPKPFKNMEQKDRFQRRGRGGNQKRVAKEHTCVYAQLMDIDKNVVKGEGE